MLPSDTLRKATFGLYDTRIRVTVPEGFHRFDIAKRLERVGLCSGEDFLAATSDRTLLARFGVEAETAEGYLFPDTYRFEPGTGAQGIAARMLERFRTHAESVLTMSVRDAGAVSPPLSPREALTLASLVEKEAVRDDERPVIARVFLNRLRDPAFQPKRLQSDPTAAYGCLMYPALASCASFDGRRVIPSILRDSANPYNTYRHPGLPPGPICNPGLASIRAVMQPAEHDYLYFVAKGGGRHTFTRTLADHNVAVDALRASKTR